ncbi:MAG TPA: hypothetical protein VGN16_09390 [Acidobacteriaceae bacterium]|jgi:hypothetical protein
MATLGWYLNDTSALLHDQSYSFTSQDQLTRWINEARRQAAQRTGCIMRVIQGQSAFGASAQAGSIIPGGMQPGALPDSAPNAQSGATTNSFNTINGVERYPYQGFVNPVLRAQHAGVKAVVDTIACSVCWGGGPGGSPRPSLAWLPWEDLQAYARAYANLVTSYPFYWSVLNDGENGELWLFPTPSQAMEIELQVFCVPKDLNNDSDYDAIPDGFANAIKFGAAALAYMTSRRYGQAQIMMDMFNDRLGTARVATDMGKTPNFYYQGF